MSTIKTLVVFELIPEETKMALVDLTQEEYEELLPASGVYINAGDYPDEQSTAAMMINDAFCEEKDHCSSAAWGCRFVDDLLLEEENDIAGVEKIIRAGFYL